MLQVVKGLMHCFGGFFLSEFKSLNITDIVLSKDMSKTAWKTSKVLKSYHIFMVRRVFEPFKFCCIL